MSFEHRGFRLTVDVAPDEAGVQWRCRAAIQGIVASTAAARLPDIELTIPKLKIDVLMALSMVEHRAVATIDEWHAQQAVAA
jgi:hypothetical protein